MSYNTYLNDSLLIQTPLNDWHTELPASGDRLTASMTRLREVVPCGVLPLRAPTIEMVVPVDGVIEVTRCGT